MANQEAKTVIEILKKLYFSGHSTGIQKLMPNDEIEINRAFSDIERIIVPEKKKFFITKKNGKRRVQYIDIKAEGYNKAIEDMKARMK